MLVTMNKISESNMSESSAIIKKMNNLSKYIKVTDEGGGLKNYCYVNDPEDGPEFEENREFISKCRGVVYDGDRLVMSAFPYTCEFAANTVGANMWIEENGGMDKCRYFSSYEGALIRMFYHNDKWYLTTHRKLNAFKSTWGGTESYGTSFKNAIRAEINNNQALKDACGNTDGNFYDDFQTILDKSKQYTFLVCNTETNRIVCTPSSMPKLFHVGTFTGGDLDIDDDIFVTKPREHKFTNQLEINNFVNGTDPYVTPGVICFAPGNKQMKISSEKYMRLYGLRGNQPSVKFRYLQLRNDHNAASDLRSLYPEHCSVLDEYDAFLEKAAVNIHDAYMKRFIKKEHVLVSQAEYAVIRAAHAWFIKGYNSDVRNIVTRNVVRRILFDQKATTLNQIVKKLRHDEIVKKKESEQANEPGVDMLVDGLKEVVIDTRRDFDRREDGDDPMVEEE
jgi:hypothetical protein